MLFRFCTLQKQHKMLILVTSLSLFVLTALTSMVGFLNDPVFAQIRFQIAIRAVPQCQNSIDDDGDTLIDYPSDPDCTSMSDTSE